MEWHIVIMAIFGILGAALIAGGIVTYRAGARVSVRAFGAASIAAGVLMWVIIVFTTPLTATRGAAPPPNSGIEGQVLANPQYEVTVQFNSSVTQDDLDEAGALLRTYDEDVEFLTTRCYLPMGRAVVTTDAPDTIEAELEAKTYVDNVSYQPRDESNQGKPGSPVEAQAPARCE